MIAKPRSRNRNLLLVVVCLLILASNAHCQPVIYFSSLSLNIFDLLNPLACTESNPCKNDLLTTFAIDLQAVTVVILNLTPALLANYTCIREGCIMRVEIRTLLALPLGPTFQATSTVFTSMTAPAIGTVSLPVRTKHLTLENWTDTAGTIGFTQIETLETFNVTNSRLLNLPLPPGPNQLNSIFISHSEFMVSLDIASPSELHILNTQFNPDASKLSAPVLSIGDCALKLSPSATLELNASVSLTLTDISLHNDGTTPALLSLPGTASITGSDWHFNQTAVHIPKSALVNLKRLNISTTGYTAMNISSSISSVHITSADITGTAAFSHFGPTMISQSLFRADDTTGSVALDITGRQDMSAGPIHLAQSTIYGDLNAENIVEFVAEEFSMYSTAIDDVARLDVHFASSMMKISDAQLSNVAVSITDIQSISIERTFMKKTGTLLPIEPTLVVTAVSEHALFVNVQLDGLELITQEINGSLSLINSTLYNGAVATLESTLNISVVGTKFDPPPSMLHPLTITSPITELSKLSFNMEETYLTACVVLNAEDAISGLVLLGDTIIPRISLAQGSHIDVAGHLNTTEWFNLTSHGDDVQLNISGVFEFPSAPGALLANQLSIFVHGTMRINLKDTSIHFTSDVVFAIDMTTSGRLDFIIPRGFFVPNNSTWVVASGFDFELSATFPRTSENMLGEIGYDGSFWLATNGTGGFELRLNISEVACIDGCWNGASCIARDLCDCVLLWSGPSCECTLLGIPSTGYCNPLGGLSWIVDDDLILNSTYALIVPENYSLNILGNLISPDNSSIILQHNASIIIGGAFYNNGSVEVRPTIETYYDPSTGVCEFQMLAYFTASELYLNSSSTINVVLDVHSMPKDVECISRIPSIDVSGSSYLDGILNITIIGDDPKRSKMTAYIIDSNEMDEPAVDRKRDVEARLNGSSNADSFQVIHSTASECSTIESSPGVVSIFVRPCSDGPSSPSKKLSFLYWTVPIIVVAILVVVAIVVILSVPSLRLAVVPYHGTNMYRRRR